MAKSASDSGNFRYFSVPNCYELIIKNILFQIASNVFLSTDPDDISHVYYIFGQCSHFRG